MKRSSVFLISLIVIAFAVLFSILYASRVRSQDDWKKRTTPLPQETRNVLCSRFELSSNDDLCNSDKDVYALDFAKLMRDTFRPYEELHIESSKAATYDEVEERIGSFQYECEPVTNQADGLSYFVCLYDLRGDREFITTIFFNYPEKAVMSLGFTSRFED